MHRRVAMKTLISAGCQYSQSSKMDSVRERLHTLQKIHYEKVLYEIKVFVAK